MKTLQIVLTILVGLAWLFMSFWAEPLFPLGSPAWLGMTFIVLVLGAILLFWRVLRRFALRINPMVGFLIFVSVGSILGGSVWFLVRGIPHDEIPKTYSIQELRELSKIFGEVKEGQKKTGTYLNMKMIDSTYNIIGSNNITSVIDNGSGDLTLTFETALNPEKMIIRVDADDGSIDYKVLAKSANSVRIKSDGFETSTVRIEVIEVED